MTQRHPDKKAGGLWEFTGGGVLAGETTKQAAVRELDEELLQMIEEKQVVWSVGLRYSMYSEKLGK